MTVATVYKQGWTMDDVHWDAVRPLQGRTQPAGRRQGRRPGGIQRPRLCHLSEARLPRRRPETLAAIERWGPRKASTAGPWAAGPRWPIPTSSWKTPLPASARAIPRAHFERRRRLGARLAPGRDDRPLRGGKRHLAPITPPSATPPRSRCCRRSPAASPPTNTATTSCSTTSCTPRRSRTWASGRSCGIAVGRVRESDDDELAYRLLLRQCAA